MSEIGKEWFEKYCGSKLIRSITYTDTFAFIGRFDEGGTGDEEVLEKLSKQEETPASVTKIVRTTGITKE